MKKPTKKSISILAVMGVIVLVDGTLLLTTYHSKPSTNPVAVTTSVPSNLPPDPGAAGKSTLAGIDTNNNGVRDDVERYIGITYADQTKIRALLMQWAVYMQQELLDASDKQKSIQHADDEGVAQDCLVYIAGSVDKAYDAAEAVQSDALNTDTRMRAYLQYNDQLGGEVFSSVPDKELASTCAALIQNAPTN